MAPTPHPLPNPRHPAFSPPQQPNTPLDKLESDLLSIIHQFYNLSLGVYGYTPPHSADVLVQSVNKLSNQLASPDFPPPDLETTLPGEVIQYVSQGRNPDIYTREFVEIVQKQNQLYAGKVKAYREFRDVLAEAIEKAFPELKDDVEKVIQETGGRSSA